MTIDIAGSYNIRVKESIRMDVMFRDELVLRVKTSK